MSSPGERGGEGRAGIARMYTLIEDVVYVGLGVLLTGLVLMLLASGFISFGRSALGWTVATSIIELLDKTLLILLLVELLYTVKVSFREHSLVPEPFLLVGLISVIRRVLVLNAEFGEKHERAESVTHASVVELAVLGALILVLAVSLMLVRQGAAQTKPEVRR